jgi:hypothetical protein
MSKIMTAGALAALALVGVSAAAHAECYWGGDHWNCADRYIYPKSYPWGTTISDGRYSRPPSPPQSDVNFPARMPVQQ